MDPRISFVTLAVADLARSRTFYCEGLGWPAVVDVPDEVVMVQAGDHLVLSLWVEAGFEAEVGPLRRGPGAPPLTLAHNVATPAGVDAVLATAAAAGAPVHAAEPREWGGYSGYFTDPDDVRWEVACNPSTLGRAVLPHPPAPGVETNALGQRVGRPVDVAGPYPWPAAAEVAGRWCRLETLRPDHAPGLAAELAGPEAAALWTYLRVGPFVDAEELAAHVADRVRDDGTWSVAVCTEQGPVGLADVMRVERTHGVAEIGNIVLGPALQRTAAATEALHLLSAAVLDAGYRRLEWKCDALNEPSRQAALRLGFRYEGRFRDHVVVKGRSRDTDWFGLTAGEWPAVRAAHRAWLAPANQPGGRQRRPLADFLADLPSPPPA